MSRTNKLQTAEVSGLLREIGQRMQLQGGNPFRARAYRTAADSLNALTRPLEQIIAAGDLTSIPGVGDAIAGVIERLYTTGSAPALESLRKDIPHVVLQMLSIPGMRTNQILKLYKDTGISDVEALQRAIESGELAGKKGVTPVFQQKVLQGLKIYREAGHKQYIHHATALLESAQENLGTTHPALRDITIAGDLRRQCELVGDLSLVAISDKPRAAKLVLSKIRLHVCREGNFGSTLLFETGSAAHVQCTCSISRRTCQRETFDAHP